jgi:ABC-type glycerol-3-phosphate transport system permease component
MRRWSRQSIKYALLVVAAGFSIFPLLVMVDTAFKTSPEIAGNQHWFPQTLTLSFWSSTLQSSLLWSWLRNSAIIATGVAVLTLAVAIPAAYVIARRQFKGNVLFLDTVLVTQTIAPAVLIVPLFELFRRFGLIGTYQGVILVSSAFVVPFSIWLLVAFFRQVPAELEEAAAIDGTMGLRFLLRFMVPTSFPGIVATGLWAFMYGWNEFMFCVTFLSGVSSKWPITIGVFSNSGEFFVQWQPLAIDAFVGTIPVLFVFVILRRRLELALGSTITG